MQLSRHIEKTLSSSKSDTVYNLNIFNSTVSCVNDFKEGEGSLHVSKEWEGSKYTKILVVPLCNFQIYIPYMHEFK